MYIVAGNGAEVASYQYDPYGNVVTATGDLAEINPLRYRGYYYDTEIGMYYLQSRYYDPELGRFINADSYASTGQGILGNNMFAYCNNNPIMYGDPSGLFSWLIVVILTACTVIGAIWGATLDAPIGSEVKAQQEETTQTRQRPDQHFQSLRYSNSRCPYNSESTPMNSDGMTECTDTKTKSHETNTLESTQSTYTLTKRQRIRNTLVGASLGLMVGGGIVLTGGAACCIFAGPYTVIGFLGMSGIQAVAWGSLAYNVFPIFVAPFYGYEIEPLELES